MLEYQYKAQAKQAPALECLSTAEEKYQQIGAFSAAAGSQPDLHHFPLMSRQVWRLLCSVWATQSNHYVFGTFWRISFGRHLATSPFLAGTVLALSIERDVSGLKVPPDRVKKLWEIFQKKRSIYGQTDRLSWTLFTTSARTTTKKGKSKVTQKLTPTTHKSTIRPWRSAVYMYDTCRKYAALSHHVFVFVSLRAVWLKPFPRLVHQVTLCLATNQHHLVAGTQKFMPEMVLAGFSKFLISWKVLSFGWRWRWGMRMTIMKPIDMMVIRWWREDFMSMCLPAKITMTMIFGCDDDWNNVDED